MNGAQRFKALFLLNIYGNTPKDTLNKLKQFMKLHKANNSQQYQTSTGLQKSMASFEKNGETFPLPIKKSTFYPSY